METPTTTLDFLALLLDQWSKTYLHVRQDGKMQYLSLNQIHDEKVVSKFVLDRLKQFRQALVEGTIEVEEEAEANQ